MKANNHRIHPLKRTSEHDLRLVVFQDYLIFKAISSDR